MKLFVIIFYLFSVSYFMNFFFDFGLFKIISIIVIFIFIILFWKENMV